MDHIVYLDKAAGALEAMRQGRKTMVGRAFNGRRSPYGKVKVGDMLYFTENDGRQIIYGRGRVTEVYDSPKLGHEESVEVLERYRRSLWLSEGQFQKMAGKRYLVLVWVDRFEEVPPFRFTRRDFHTLDDWIPVGDVDLARKEGPAPGPR
jgi:ASC-1-like (ASCH) protein